MNTSKHRLQALRRLICAQACLMIVAVPFSYAQQAPTTAPDAATLTKYDKNKNGRLDADEVATMQADQRRAVPVQQGAEEKAIELSPFEVTTDTKGYYSSSTMSGTRFNSKIEDMGASITVITKEQMTDFAMLDINDIFLYAGNTEGTGTYTDFTIDRNGSYSDNVELNPQGANRVRGIAAANVSLGNFETQGRNPVDPLAIDAVEVSRGPNANVFGLGSPAGTVNQVPSSANTTRDRTTVAFRVDSYGGYRTSIDLNRVLIQNKLAARFSAAFQHNGFIRKPSGTNEVRFNGMLRFEPFKKTRITATYSFYRMNGNRPNSAPPRDQVTYWRDSGRASFDPVTNQVHLNGVTIGTFSNATGLPDYFLNTFTGNTRSQLFVDHGQLAYWTTSAANSGTGPGIGNQSIRFISSSGAAGVALGHITAQPLFTTTPTVRDKSMYDWEKINVAGLNRVWDRTLTTRVEIDQTVFSSQRQSLNLQGSFFREDSMRYTRNLLSEANQNGQSGQMIIDVNERRYDGTPNPFFLHPYLGSDTPATTRQPSKWDTYRAQAAYRLDLTQEDNLLKWVGLHQFTIYDEYKYRISRQYRWRDVIASNHAWAKGGPSPAYMRYYVGDGVGFNIDYAPTDLTFGTYDFVWGNGLTGVFNHEPTTIGLGAGTDNAGGGSNSKTIQKTVGGVLQSHFWNDRIVTTFGRRQDKIGVKFGAASTGTNPIINTDGLTYNNANFVHWATNDWRANSGKTKTGGVVLKPFRDMAFLSRLNDTGSVGHFASNLLGGLTVYYNESDSFTPQTPAQSLFLKVLPNSSGEGKDYGMSLNMFDGKFNVRVNHYINKSLNSRNGDANTIAQRVLRHDVVQTDPFQLHNKAVIWVTSQNPTWTTDQIEDEVAKQIGIPRDLQGQLTRAASTLPIAATNDVIAKGNEVEINFNPTTFWTVSANVTQTHSITANVSSSVQEWIDLRMPIWLTIKDPTINITSEPQQLWWTHNYGGSQTAEQNFQTFVESPYAVIRAQEGKPKPSVREYGFRLSTNFGLSGITDHRILKNVRVGGALRWEDQGAIGNYGVQSLPAVITALDPNRPIWDKAHFYVDLNASYQMRLYNDKIRATFRLNVRNVQENGRLQATQAFPSGTPSSLRIIDPRQFILEASFDL